MQCVSVVKSDDDILYHHSFTRSWLLAIEIDEFVTYVHEGATIQTSAFLSSLMTLLGTHGAHVTFGFFWGVAILIQVAKRGLNPQTANKAFIFSLYWHFLDVVWIFIFSFVYLKGLIS